MGQRAELRAESILEAVKIANSLRSQFGGSVLGDLPASTPKDAKHCVLAQAFGFECSVDQNGPGSGWRVWFPREYQAQAEYLADQVGTTASPQLGGGFSVSLPSHVGAIAQDFDAGLLPAEYYA